MFLRIFLIVEFCSFLSAMVLCYVLETELKKVNENFFDLHSNQNAVLTGMWNTWSPEKQIRMTFLAAFLCTMSIPSFLTLYVVITIREWMFGD